MDFYSPQSVGHTALLVLIFLTSVVAIAWLHRSLHRIIQRFPPLLAHTLYAAFGFLIPLLYFAIAYLLFAPQWGPYLENFGKILLAVQSVRLAIASALYLFQFSWQKHHPRSNPLLLQALSRLLRFCAWLAIAFISAQYLGYDLSQIIKGVGIAGIIASLTAQTLFADVFNYLVIYFDRPFEVGDYITIQQQGIGGTVEYIGIKSTRLRAVEGQTIALSNSQLMGGAIQNYKNIKQRRVVFQLLLDCGNPSHLLSQIPSWIREIIDNTNDTQFERAHLLKFVRSSLLVEISYSVLSSDYMQFLNVNQMIILQIKQLCEKRQIRFTPSIGLCEGV